MGIYSQKFAKVRAGNLRQPFFKDTPLYDLSAAQVLYLLLAVSDKPSQGLVILLSVKPCFLQFGNPSPRGGYQPGRHDEESLLYGMNHAFYLLLVQYFFLEEVHKVIGKHQNFKPTDSRLDREIRKSGYLLKFTAVGCARYLSGIIGMRWAGS